LDWRWHQRALSYGCMMAVNPDAHSVREIDLTRWGVKMARKGGVPKEKIINTFGGPALSDFFRSRRGQTASPSQRTQRKQVGAH
jgi:DNA polymerase (family 10)